jgi:hypothetical protein
MVDAALERSIAQERAGGASHGRTHLARALQCVCASALVEDAVAGITMWGTYAAEK